MLWWSLKKLRSTDSSTRERGIAELVRRCDVSSVYELVKLVADNQRSEVRVAAEEAIKQMGEAAVGPLASTLQHPIMPLDHRRVAAKLLGNLGEPSIHALLLAFARLDPPLRDECQITLEHIHNWRDTDGAAIAADELTQQWRLPSVKAKISETLILIGQPALRPLSHLFQNRIDWHSHDPEKRKSTLSLIAAIGGVAAAETLVSIADEASSEISDEALVALEEIREYVSLDIMIPKLQRWRNWSKFSKLLNSIDTNWFADRRVRELGSRLIETEHGPNSQSAFEVLARFGYLEAVVQIAEGKYILLDRKLSAAAALRTVGDRRGLLNLLEFLLRLKTFDQKKITEAWFGPARMRTKHPPVSDVEPLIQWLELRKERLNSLVVEWLSLVIESNVGHIETDLLNRIRNLETIWESVQGYDVQLEQWHERREIVYCGGLKAVAEISLSRSARGTDKSRGTEGELR